MKRRLPPLCLCVCLLGAQTQAPQTPPAPPAASAPQPAPVPQAAPQTTPPAAAPSPASGGPVIKVTTRLLQISVVVHDKKGEPVSDLTKEDFVLYDKGQEQKIRYFFKEVSAPPPDSAMPAIDEAVISNRFVSVKVDGKVKAQPLPDSLTVILLDGLNTSFTDQHYAKEGLVKFLKQLRPGDQVAIYTLANGLRVLHDFTSDISSLLTALDRHRNQESVAAASSTYEDANTGDDNLDGFLDQANEKIANYYQANRTLTTLQALQAIANRLAGLPGRKNLIWLSSGFPIYVGLDLNGSAVGQPITTAGTSPQDFQSFGDEEQRAWRALNDVGVAVYPVDERGLISTDVYSPSTSAASRSKIPRTGRPAMDTRAQNQINQSQSVMRELAERTGGRAFINDNDIAASVRDAMNDARITYVLYYTPSHDEWDGKFRDIKIKVNRPGLEARYRKGYYALPDLSTDPKSRQASLSAAAMSALPATGLTLLAKLIDKPTEAAPHATISLVMDAHDIHFERNAQGQVEANVDMMMLVFSDQSSPQTQTGRVVHLLLKPEQYDQVMKGGVRLALDVEAPPNSRRVRIVTRDAASGKVGSLDVPIK
jgi:VWFA-related protein